MVHNSVARQGDQTLAGTLLEWSAAPAYSPAQVYPENVLRCLSMRPKARFVRLWVGTRMDSL
jgi:hypothetical protein